MHAGSDEAGKLRGAAADASAWRRLLAEAVRDPDELWRLLELPPELLLRARQAAQAFPLLVPRGYLALIRHGDPADPLLRQVLPLGDELADPPGFTADPLGESGCQGTPGLLQKYRGRALLVTTGACAVHCRYCFRRHFPYQELPRGWDDALARIADDPSCEELLLSGGDPLTLPDAQLARLTEAAAGIPHLQRLRIHTRLPVVLPERVTAPLIDAFRSRLPLAVVIHANHPRELSPAVADACARWRAAGATLLNQSVLLAGVNDNGAVLAELSRRLFAAGVLPYYLHQLDHVSGAGHFAVGDQRARELHRALHAILPGYLLPRLVREEPGAAGKTLLS
jgi:EF-P beta-lysylation protein EpmB